MPYETLESIHDSKLPLIFTCASQANAIRSYVAAGLVIAEFHPVAADQPYGERPGCIVSVVAITPSGRKTIERLRAGRSMKNARVRAVSP